MRVVGCSVAAVTCDGTGAQGFRWGDFQHPGVPGRQSEASPHPKSGEHLEVGMLRVQKPNKELYKSYEVHNKLHLTHFEQENQTERITTSFIKLSGITANPSDCRQVS